MTYIQSRVWNRVSSKVTVAFNLRGQKKSYNHLKWVPALVVEDAVDGAEDNQDPRGEKTEKQKDNRMNFLEKC